MPRWVQNSFFAGVLAPEIYTRSDTTPYQSSVAFANNFWPSDRGPIVRRPPTFRFGEVWDQTRTYRIVPFALSLSQQYLLVFASDDTMRVLDVGSRAWVESSPGVPLSVSMGGRMDTPAKVQNFAYAQTGRILLLRRSDTYPWRLEYTSLTSWNVSDHEYKDGPWDPLNSEATTVVGNNSAPANVTQLTFSANTLVSTDVTRLVRVGKSDLAEWAVYKIVTVTSATVAQVTFQVGTTSGGLNTATATKNWRLGAYWQGNYPAKVALYEDRVVESSTPDSPESIFVATTSGFDEKQVTFSPTSLNNNSISDAEGFVRIPPNLDRGAGTTQWLKSGRDLYIGTTSGVYSLTTRSGAGAFGPLSARLTPIADVRVNAVPPQIDGNNLLVIEAGGRRPLRLSEAAARLETTFIPKEVSFFSGHLFYDNTVTGSLKINYPYPYAFFTMSDGRLYSLLYNEDVSAEKGSDLVGIFPHELGGGAAILQGVDLFSSGSTAPELWFLVEREIDGDATLQIEYLIGQSALTNNALAHVDHQRTLTWSGTTPQLAPEYAGKTVTMVIDGADYGTVDVASDGSFMLPREPETALTVGYPYTSEFWTIPPVRPLGQGQELPLSRTIRIKSATAIVLNSVDLEFGAVDLGAPNPSATKVKRGSRASIPGNSNPSARPPLFSGGLDLRGTSGGGAITLPSIYISTQTSYPLNVSAILLEYMVSSDS